MSRERLTLALAVLLLLTPIGVVVAQTVTHPASAGVPYQTTSGVEVTLGDDRDIAAQPFVDDQTWSSGNLTVSGSDAQVQVGDAAFDSDPITVRNVDVTGSLTVERSDLSRSFTVESGDANVLQVRDYGVDNGQEDFAYDSDNGLNVTLTGVKTVNIAAVDVGTGQPLAVTETETGTVSFSLPAGQHSIRLEATPATLEVRNEANPNELIDNATVRARLFPSGGTVIERRVSDGEVSLDGVPADEPLVVTVREENADYVYRRILLNSVVETSEIYLLPTDEPSAEVRFQLQDQTGRFDDDTKLFVEKPINRDFDGDGSNETRYQVISGDRVGADGEFPTILIDSTRYRLRVENDAGEQRVLGSYVVQGARVSVLPIGRVEFEANVDEGAALQADLREAPAGASYDHEVRFTYLDPTGKTDEIEVSITDGDGNKVRPTTTEQINTTAAYVETYPLNSSFDPTTDTATVSVEASRGLETETYSSAVGDVPDIPIGPLNPQLAELIGLASIVGVAGLLIIKSPPLAAFISPGYAGLLTLIGVIDVPMAAVVLAGLVGVLAVVGTSGVR